MNPRLKDTYAFLTSCVLDSCMHFVDSKPNASERHGEVRQPAPLHPGAGVLRRAVRRNIVSFPSQVPVFLKHPTGDMQWRIVLLFFVRGWSASKVAARFSVPIHRIWRILNDWSVRALELGYIQVIDPDAFAMCCRDDAESGTDRDTKELPAEVGPVCKSMPQSYPGEAAMAGAPCPSTPEGVRLDDGPFDSRGNGADLIAALDLAIAHCEEWRGEFWAHTAMLLRNLRTAAAVALAIPLLSEPANGLFRTFLSGKGSAHQGVPTRDEERVSHVV